MYQLKSGCRTPATLLFLLPPNHFCPSILNRPRIIFDRPRFVYDSTAVSFRTNYLFPQLFINFFKNFFNFSSEKLFVPIRLHKNKNRHRDSLNLPSRFFFVAGEISRWQHSCHHFLTDTQFVNSWWQECMQVRQIPCRSVKSSCK